MATSLHAAILVVATLAVLFIGSADAWNQCPSGYKDCNPHKPGCETCIRNDVNNCGDCGKKCTDLPYTTTKCDNHKCVYTCKPGWADCDHKRKNGCETDIEKDPHNCGKCGKKCKQVAHAITKCSHRHCQKPVCHAGWGNCDHNIWNGCETCLDKDVYNCGKCHKKCEVTLKGGEATCKKGQCGQQCKKGTKLDKVNNCCVRDH